LEDLDCKINEKNILWGKNKITIKYSSDEEKRAVKEALMNYHDTKTLLKDRKATTERMSGSDWEYLCDIFHRIRAVDEHLRHNEGFSRSYIREELSMQLAIFKDRFGLS
jgi:hypothetical protein